MSRPPSDSLHPHDVLRALQRHPALSKLSDETRVGLAAMSVTFTVRGAQPLWRSGEPVSDVRLVLRGVVALATGGTGDRAQILALRTQGEAVDEAALLVGDTHAHDAFAVTSSVLVAALPIDATRAALARDGVAAMAWASLVADRLRALERSAARAQRPVEERLARVLLDLAARFGDELEDGATIVTLRLSRAQIAAMAATTVDSAVRTLTRWSRAGLVTVSGEGIVLHGLDRFAQAHALPEPTSDEAY